MHIAFALTAGVWCCAQFGGDPSRIGVPTPGIAPQSGRPIGQPFPQSPLRQLPQQQLPSQTQFPKTRMPQSKFTQPGRFPLTQPPNARIEFAPVPTPTTGAQSPVAVRPATIRQSPAERTFDPRLVQVRWRNNRWELTAGDVWIKDFGSRGTDARESLRVIRQLELNSRGQIGSPAPIMEYWLSNGRAPKDARSSLRTFPIDGDSLRVEKINDNWCVRDNRRLFFNFGVQHEYADQALAVMRKHGFAQIGYVGNAQPSMIYFIGGRPGWGKSTIRPRSIQASGIPRANIDKKSAQTDLRLVKNTKQASQSSKSAILSYQALQLARGTRQLSRPLTGMTTRYRIDPNRVALRRNQHRWTLYGQHLTLADFGEDYQTARKARMIMRQYGCTDYCRVGTGVSGFGYFLVNGAPPRGLRYNSPGVSFRTEEVSVKQLGNDWCVCAGNTTLGRLGTDKKAAEAVHGFIRRNRIDHAVPVGPNVQMLVRSR